MHWVTALVCAGWGLLSGWLLPAVIARVPEPAEASDGDVDVPVKVLYTDIAAQPRLAWVTAGLTGLLAGAIGGQLGWTWSLASWMFLTPVGVALAVIDSRTRMLPTWLIRRGYAGVLLLLLLALVATRDLDDLVRALMGMMALFSLYFLLWLIYPKGMGFGDVRLSGLLGLALGQLGWGELVVGGYSGFLLGSVGWVPLRLFRLTRTRHFPFGPFMLLGAVVGVLWGAELWEFLYGGQG